KTIERPIRLPARGEARNEFIDLPQAGPVVSVKIEGSDDLEADDQAWLVRGESWPVIETRSALPPELRRVIDIYNRRRPATQTSAHVAVFAAPAELPGSDPAVAVATPASAARMIGSSQLLVSYSPI